MELKKLNIRRNPPASAFEKIETLTQLAERNELCKDDDELLLYVRIQLNCSFVLLSLNNLWLSKQATFLKKHCGQTSATEANNKIVFPVMDAAFSAQFLIANVRYGESTIKKKK